MIKSLHRKKGRTQHQLFVVEGEKLVAEAIKSVYEVDRIYVCDEKVKLLFASTGIHVLDISHKDMEKITAFNTPSPVLALVRMRSQLLPLSDLKTTRFLMLDSLRDPGNLGTIIRTADWFGINHLVLSSDSVDVFNHKVLQSTMGSFFRAKFLYTDLPSFLQELSPWSHDIPVYGAVLGGDSLKTIDHQNTKGALVIGSESHGISEEVQRFCSHLITIPPMGEAESLNAAVAASILLYEWQAS